MNAVVYGGGAAPEGQPGQSVPGSADGRDESAFTDSEKNCRISISWGGSYRSAITTTVAQTATTAAAAATTAVQRAGLTDRRMRRASNSITGAGSFYRLLS
jgi:hypothetical protein